MTPVESKVKAALDAYAEARPADTDTVWRGVRVRTSRRSPLRAWPVLVAAALVVVAVGGVTVVVRQAGQTQVSSTSTPTAGTATPGTPSSTPRPKATPHPKPSATMAPPLSPWPVERSDWQYTYTVPSGLTEAIRTQTGNHFDAGTTWVPVDVLTTTSGQRFVLSGGLATISDAFGKRAPAQLLCWRTEPLPPLLESTRSGPYDLCSKPTLPNPTEGATSDKYWSQPHNLDYYPPIPGDSIIEDERFQFAYGVAALGVDHVIGIDTDGHRHQGRMIGRGLSWKAQLYVFVAEKEVTFERFEAYGPTGALLSRMDPECPGPCKAPR